MTDFIGVPRAVERPVSTPKRAARPTGNEARNARILAMRLSGMFCTDIAKQLGITRNTVIGVCGRAGIVLNDRAEASTAHLPRGSDHCNAKLTADDVRYIRDKYIPYDREFGASALAFAFGVSHTAVQQVIDRESWKHVA